MVKAQVEGFKCVRGRRGTPGDAKATGISRDQVVIIHAHKWLLSRFTGLLYLPVSSKTSELKIGLAT